MPTETSVPVLERLPSFGFGAAPLGNLYRARSDAECEALLEAAWARGIRYFDTAPLYGFGLSEQRLGAFLRTKPRDEFFISTKVGRLLAPNAGDHPQRAYFIDAAPFEPIFDYSRDGILRSHEVSLKRLGLDRVDILLMHDIGEATHGATHEAQFAVAMEGGYRAMEELRRSGAVGAIGIGVNEWQVCAEAMASHHWDCLLLAGRHSLLDHDALDFLGLCVDMGVRVIAGGVFNSGILATGVIHAARFNYDAAPSDVVARVKALSIVCAAHHVPLGAAAVQFPYTHPAIASVIAGFGSEVEFSEVMDWAALPIPDALWRDLKAQGLLPADLPPPLMRRAP
jgi:D-threo-aldose 1-dehydrogenase